MSQLIETETVEQPGCTFRIAIFADETATNPLEDWDEMGTILSLNRRHVNFDPEGVAAAQNNADAIPLSYYEHGLCLWSVAGELPPGAACPFDSVAFAGIWLPDVNTLASARLYGGWTRRQFMRTRARQACDVYTAWCNGEVYGYEITRLTACRQCSAECAEPVDSCWGFYGLEPCLCEARAVVIACAA